MSAYTSTDSHSDTAEHEAVLTLPDGHALSYATYGAADGPLVVVLDGPGSRGLARAAGPIAATLGVRLAAPDRAGFGTTTPAPGRGIADWPADHAALLDALGAPQAGILAQSGGTPYALAAAGALPERTDALALVGALAPLDQPEPRASAGRQLRTATMLARRAPWLLRAGLRAAARGARKDPEKAARRAAKDLPPADAAVLEDPALWAIHKRATAEILARPEAIAQELSLLAQPWGIKLDRVACPVALWSGERDVVHPTTHSRWLAARLGDAPVEVVAGAATFGMLPIYTDAVAFAAQLAAAR
ncbi:MAG TPA: alpha/beta hydrolase [Conexibacter sp.]|nr:alpha/beta hydrolase [Conexibacter sp.]